VKWFKHETNASQDAKLKRLRMKYGLEGLGLYWYCLELIGAAVEPHNLNFELEHDAEIIADDLNMHYEKVQEMMLYMIKLGLFEQNGVVITCLKMAVRADEYTQKIMRNIGYSGRNRDTIPTPSGASRDKVPSNRIERKNRKKDTWIVPDGLNKESWREYEEHRKQMKSPLSDLAKTKAANQIKDLPQEEQQKVIDKSIRNGWKGLFPDNDSVSGDTALDYGTGLI
jgi:hypothetical protein